MFFISHLSVGFKIITLFEIKDLMVCMFNAFSVIHSGGAAMPTLSVL